MHPERKVATLLSLLSTEQTVELLRRLDPADARRILAAMSTGDPIIESDVERLATEFAQLVQTDIGKATVGKSGVVAQKVLDAARLVLGDPSFDKDIHTQIELQELRRLISIFEEEALVRWLVRERATVAGTVLAIASPEQSARLFRKLPANFQADVCWSIASSTSLTPAIITTLLEQLREEVEVNKGCRVGGVERVALILQNVDSELRGKLLERLEERDSNLATQIKRSLLTVQRLSTISQQDLSRVCGGISDQDLAQALRLESEEVRSRFLSAVSKRRAERILEDLNPQARIAKNDAETSAARLVETAERLQSEGVIRFPWDEELV